MLTAIEKLDLSFPGLEAQVGVWFDQGISVRKAQELLRAKYQVLVPRATLGSFRAKRWAPKREALRQKLMTAVASPEVFGGARIKACLVECSIQAKARALFYPALEPYFRPGKSRRIGASSCASAQHDAWGLKGAV